MAIVVVAALALSAATAGAVQTLAVSTGLDLDPTGNTSTSLSTIDACRSVSVGDTFNIDVWVKDIPPASDGSGGLSSFGYNFVFDPKVLEVTAVDDRQMMAAAGTPFELIDGDSTNGAQPDPLPGTTGNVRVDFALLSVSQGYPAGSGVLSRLTLKAVGAGASQVTLTDTTEGGSSPAPQIYDKALQVYPIASVQNGIVASGEACPAAPTPLEAGSDGLPSLVGQGVVNPTATTAPAETPQSSLAPGETPRAGTTSPGTTPLPTTGASNGGGGDDTGLIVGIAAGAVAGVALLGGAAAYLLRRRRVS